MGLDANSPFIQRLDNMFEQIKPLIKSGLDVDDALKICGLPATDVQDFLASAGLLLIESAALQDKSQIFLSANKVWDSISIRRELQKRERQKYGLQREL